jgi:hypothetical protein
MHALLRLLLVLGTALGAFGPLQGHFMPLQEARRTLPDLVLVLAPLGSCCLPVSCSGPLEPAPRVELAACSDRTKAQQRRERPGYIAY